MCQSVIGVTSFTVWTEIKAQQSAIGATCSNGSGTVYGTRAPLVRLAPMVRARIAAQELHCSIPIFNGRQRSASNTDA